MSKKLRVFLAVAVLLPTFSFFGCVSSLSSRLDNVLATNWSEYAGQHPGFNGGVAVYLITPKGNYFSSYNWASDANEKVHFRGASTTKTYTAAAIMLLNQQGKLRISDKITALIPGQNEPYVPDTADYAIPHKDQITIEMLLNHRAGVWDVSNELYSDTQNYPSYVKDQDPEHQFDYDELVRVVSSRALSYFVPGTSYHYSDTGYSLLGKIIERVSGQRFDEFVHDKLLSPNNLSQTTFPRLGTDLKLPTPYAAGYLWSQNKSSEVTEDNMSPHIAEGNVITTPLDLANWLSRLFKGEAGLSKATVALMMNVLPSERNEKYGLGISFVPGLGYGHDGGHVGYVTSAYFDPDLNTTVVVSTTNLNADDFVGYATFVRSIVQKAKSVFAD